MVGGEGGAGMGVLRMPHCWFWCFSLTGVDGGEGWLGDLESWLDGLCAESLSRTSCEVLIGRSDRMEALFILRRLSSVE
jgi:hypothetical protein